MFLSDSQTSLLKRLTANLIKLIMSQGLTVIFMEKIVKKGNITLEQL